MESFTRANNAYTATLIRDALLNDADPASLLQGFVADDVRFVKNYFVACSGVRDERWLFRLTSVAHAINPHLARRELERIWSMLEHAPCFANLSAIEQDWVTLLHRVALRDARGMAARAAHLLSTTLAALDPRAEYLLLAAVLGYTASGDLNAARQTWEQNAPSVYSEKKPPLLARLIVAHAYSTNAARTLPLIQ